METELDELVVGITREQLRRVPQRWAVAGGAAKHAAVRAALRFRAAVAECYWDPARRAVALDLKSPGQLQGRTPEPVLQAQPDDVALVLHTRYVFVCPSFP